jgi:hypothetical protein
VANLVGAGQRRATKLEDNWWPPCRIRWRWTRRRGGVGGRRRRHF